MTQIVTKPGPQELLRQLSPAMYRQAYSEGKSLSAWLEEQDPSEGYNDGLDAFRRLLKVADIRTKAIPELGIHTDLFDKFFQNDQTRMLVPEFLSRKWREVTTGGKTGGRSVITAGDNVPGTSMAPWVDAADVRMTPIRAAIPLARLVALTTPVNGDAYRAFYLTNATTTRMVRVAETAELPRVKLTGGDHTIRLYKYGRIIEASYEALRRQRIDQVSLTVAQLAAQAEADKVATAIDVLVNGDGNANTAATSYNLTALDSGTTAGNPTWKAWVAFEMKFTGAYIVNAVITQEDNALKLRLLTTGTANQSVPSSKFTPINQDGGQVGLGWTPDAPANTIVGIDTRFALERAVEIGADIQEIERWATQQVQLLVLSETEGYAVRDANATKLIATNA